MQEVKFKNMKKILTVSLLSLFLFSCQNNIYGISNVQKKVINNLSQTGAKIKLTINTKSFSKKSNDASNYKTSLDIKSYTAFLTKNKINPFSEGAVETINVNKSDLNQLIFENIPSGGPYYAVVAAYDDVIESSTRKNITQENLDILNIDNEWSISTNSVSVDETYNTTFEPIQPQSLTVNLKLKDSMPVKIGTEITINNGIDNSNNFGAY